MMNTQLLIGRFAGLASAIAVLAGLAFPVSAAPLVNGNFESWADGKPTSWEGLNSVGTTQVTGLDGTGSAAKLGAGSSNTTALRQIVDSIGGQFLYQLDFSQPSVAAGSTGMATTLRGSSSNGTVYLNARVIDGTLKTYNGSAFISVTGATVNATDVYRLTIAGNQSTASYDLTLKNLTTNAIVASHTNWSIWQTGPNATTFITNPSMDRGRSTIDWTVDNVVLTVPEPTAVMLLALGGSSTLSRRRR
jgi:hypothetical protein